MEQVAQFGIEHVSDLAVHPSMPEVLAVGAVDGSVHRYTRFTREKGWLTQIPNPRVCWADDKVLVWGTQKQAAVLHDDGSSTAFETTEQADLAVAGNRLLAASPTAGLISFQLSSGQPVLREKVRRLEGYRDRSLITSSLGAVALVADRHIFFQPRADANWQEVDQSCRLISFSPDGRTLAVAQSRAEGAELATIGITKDGTLDVEHRSRAFPLLASAVSHIEWSLDGSSILVLGVDGELEVRNVHTTQLTFSMRVAGIPRSYPQNNAIITGSPKGLHSYLWEPARSKLWIARRSGSATPDRVEVVGHRNMSRGDEVLLFVDDPTLRPAGVYEIINGTHSNDDAEPPSPIIGALRVSLPPPPEQNIAQERELIERLANVSPLRDTRTLGIHDAALRLLRNLYPSESATMSQLEAVLDRAEMHGPNFRAGVAEEPPVSGSTVAPTASRIHPQLQPLRGLFERYAGVVSFVDVALVARLGMQNDIISARFTATCNKPPEVCDEQRGWIALRTGLGIETFGDLLSQLSRGAIAVGERTYSFLIADNSHFNGFHSRGRGLGSPVNPVAHTMCAGGPISAVLKAREFFHWRDHHLPVDSSFFDLENLIERLRLRQPLQDDSDYRQLHVEFELPLELELLTLTAASFSISLRITGQHTTKVPLLVKFRNEASKDTANYHVDVGDEPIRLDWQVGNLDGSRVSVRISDSTILLMDESFEAHPAKDILPSSPSESGGPEDVDAMKATDQDPLGFIDYATNSGTSPRVLGLLGSGAEADVYLVQDRFGREVAAKVFYESKRVPEHIFAHAVGMARVPHPAVATLYSIDNVVDHDGQTVPAILMERLKGEELDQRLQREVVLDEVIEWGRTILEIFEAMHSVGHFHPDPHPGNFFVTDHGLRIYDVLYSLTAEQRSTRTKEALRLANARHVRGLIEALFDRLSMSEEVQVAARMFTTRTRNVDLTLEAIRTAFSDSIELISTKSRSGEIEGQTTGSAAEASEPSRSAIDGDIIPELQARLADAYARWMPLALSKLREAEHLASQCNHASWHKKGPALLEVRPKLFQIAPLFQDIANAASEILLFEQDTSLRQRIESLTRRLSPVPNGLGGRHHQAVVALNAEVRNRRRDGETLIEAIRLRLLRLNPAQ